LRASILIVTFFDLSDTGWSSSSSVDNGTSCAAPSSCFALAPAQRGAAGLEVCTGRSMRSDSGTPNSTGLPSASTTNRVLPVIGLDRSINEDCAAAVLPKTMARMSARMGFFIALEKAWPN